MKTHKKLLIIFLILLSILVISFLACIHRFDSFSPSKIHALRIVDTNVFNIPNANVVMYDKHKKPITPASKLFQLEKNKYPDTISDIFILNQLNNISSHGWELLMFGFFPIILNSSESYTCVFEAPHYKPFSIDYDALTNKCFQDTLKYTNHEIDSIELSSKCKIKKVRILLKKNR